MQKDIQKSKGETQQPKEANKIKEVGHDINAKLKENVGVGVGNYSSQVDRQKACDENEKYEVKREKEQFEKNKKEVEKKLTGESNLKGTEEKKGETGTISHKVQEIGHNVNANLKENLGVGVGDYPSQVDRQKASEHKEIYDEKIDEQKEKLKEKKEDFKESVESGSTGIYAHRIQEVGHNINATLKENIGVGVGNFSSEVDREKASEHREKYDEKVKEETKPEVGEGSSLGHKIKEVAHNINANLKEMIGIGVGNYSSEIDRELAHIHHEKYEEMTHITNPEEFNRDEKDWDKKDEKEFKRDDKQPLKKDEKEFKRDEKDWNKKDEKEFKRDDKQPLKKDEKELGKRDEKDWNKKGEKEFKRDDKQPLKKDEKEFKRDDKQPLKRDEKEFKRDEKELGKRDEKDWNKKGEKEFKRDEKELGKRDEKDWNKKDEKEWSSKEAKQDESSKQKFGSGDNKL